MKLLEQKTEQDRKQKENEKIIQERRDELALRDV